MKSLGVDRRKNRLTMWILFVGLALLGAVVTILCGYKTQQLQKQVEEELHSHLEQTSHDIHALVSGKLGDTVQALETAADVVARLPREEILPRFLSTFTEGYQFSRSGVVGMDGRMTAMDGTVVDMSGDAFIRRAMEEGSPTLSLYTCPMDTEQGIAYTVPIRRGGEQVGLLVANSSRATARAYLGVAEQSGEGYCVIIDGRGDVVLAAQNDYAVKEKQNFYAMAQGGTMDRDSSLDRMKADMAAGKDGILYYTLADGVEKAMIYSPLGVSDWYLLSVVPIRSVSSGLQRLIGAVVLIDVVVLLLFFALVAAVTLLFRGNAKRLEEVAFVDPVTGGPNRAGFEELAGALLHGAPPGSYAMVSMDMDRFKLINETFGTDHGNRTLWHVFRSVDSQLGKGELAARISSDVFSVLLKNAPREELLRRLGGIAAEVNKFNNGRKDKYFLPLYQGVYVVEDPTLDFISVQDRANAARKSNRKIRQGRLNACVFYDDVFGRIMRREKEIDDRVETALENGEFVVYLQPKVELKWNTAVGAEALVRWLDPERGLVPPDEFIRAFEKNGFIIKLDLYVFEQVCRLLRRWLDEGQKVVPISVNLSRVHMENLDFLKAYERVRARYGVPAELIEFELTESVVMDNMQALRGVMDGMHSMGFRCSLDDFGSGYSSLNVLKDMPVDTIKLDRAFFSDTEDGERSERVVESVLELARRLSIETVCEGVEDPHQVEFLRRVRCDMVQGFVFSRPVPVEEFETLAFGGKPMNCGDGESAPVT